MSGDQVVAEDIVLCDNVEFDNNGAINEEFSTVMNENKIIAGPRDQLSESLDQIQNYNSDGSTDLDSEDDSEDSSSADSSSSESGSANSEGDTESEYEELEKVEVTLKKGKSKEEKPVTDTWLSILGVDDKCTEIPDISSLDIKDDEKFIQIGNFDIIIDKIATVNGIPEMPTCDLDTLLFLEEGKKVLGYIIDVMGPVSAPVYIVGYSADIFVNIQLPKGTKVYCAPSSKYTKYVSIGDLMRIRGSDASWVGDEEVPPEFQEFSDDEQERLQKRMKKESSKRPRPPQYQQDVGMQYIMNPVAFVARNTPPVISPFMPPFDPSVPPPNFRPLFSLPPRSMFPPFQGPQNFNKK